MSFPSAHLPPALPCRLFVRCERQTLVKLPESGAVQFTVRTYVRPLREYLSKPADTLKSLRQAIATMPDIWVSCHLLLARGTIV